MGFKQFLLEMFVNGDRKLAKSLIAYKEHIWLFDEEGKPLFKNLDEFTKNTGYVWEDDTIIHDIRDKIVEERPDMVVGYLYDKMLAIPSGQFTFDPKSSVIIQKIVKELGLKKVDVEQVEDTATTRKKDILGKIPDIAYHGTSFKYLQKIIYTGIRPNEAESNYAKHLIIHEDFIFFATRLGEAFHHSVTTAHNTKSYPVIIEFKIPDKSLIVPDYDVDTFGKMEHYGYISKEMRQKHRQYSKMPEMDSMKLSKEFGIYGYKGNIKPAFFTKFYFSKKEEVYEITDFKKFTIKQMKKIIDMGIY